MPRKQAKRKLVEFTEIEWELLQYLAGRGPAQSVLSQALLAFAQHDPKFDLDTFAKHLAKNVAPKLNEDQREALKMQLNALRRHFAGDVAPSFDEHIDSANIFQR